MSLLINCQTISKQFGARPLFENLSITISDEERIGLIGPNGAGKSTLLQILAGVQTPDDGTVSFRKGLHTGYVPQDTQFNGSESARGVLEAAVAGLSIEQTEKDRRVSSVLGRAGFPDEQAVASSLSGGWKKRLAIARALVLAPDILLLDEPTNHLDLEGIEWLEKLLANASFASVVVSHDRYFLENAANHMAEINPVYPDGLFRSEGSYSEFLLKRDDFLGIQTKRQEALTNTVKREVEWLRRGAKARTSKSKARIDAAGQMIGELAEMNARGAKGTVRIDFSASARKTKRLITASGVSKSMGGRKLFDDLKCTLMPGMRMGLVGGNGTGKTTLLKILSGELAADGGTVERADNLRVVYFEQSRDTLDPAHTLRRALSPYGDSVIFRDQTVHVVSWAKRFLFRTEQLDMPVHRLSGGERARVLIARLMLEPADLLLLDEPTNDLDIPTLEVLEENLTDFTGALVLVTHDRFMLDRVCNVVLGLDGQGGAGLFADYLQWEESQAELQAPSRPADSVKPAPAPTPSAKKRLSYIENREWESMEDQIHAAETVVANWHKSLEDPEVQRDAKRLVEAYAAVEQAQDVVDRLYERWGELGAKLQ